MKPPNHLLSSLFVLAVVCGGGSDLPAQDYRDPAGDSSGTSDFDSDFEDGSGTAGEEEEREPVDLEGAFRSKHGIDGESDPGDPDEEDEEFDSPGDDGEMDAETGEPAGSGDGDGEAPAADGRRFPWPPLPFGRGKPEVEESEEGEPEDGAPARLRERMNKLLPGILGGAGTQEPVEIDSDEESLSKVVELKRLAVRSYRNTRLSEAIRYINDLITIKPYDAGFHFALGLCYRKEGKRKEALKKYQDVLDLGGPRAMVAILKAEIFAQEGDREKVYESLKEAAIGGRNVISDVQNLAALTKYKNETDFIKLALQLEQFEVMRGRRHDPFTNPFPKISTDPVADGDTVIEDDTGPLPKEKQAKLLREARKLTERIQFYIKLRDEDKAMGAYMRLKALVDQQQRIDVPKIEQEFRRIVLALPDIEIQISGIRLRYYYNQAQEKLKTMREVFEDGEYGRVEKIHGDLENLAREMISANDRYRPVADQVLERSRRWMNRARVRTEFETRKPEIQGIIIAGNSKMTILNERIVRQGEDLDGIRVVKIESNRVTFRYKGEEIPMVFRRY